MLFNSWNFVVFFLLVTGLYFLLPHRYRWCMLLVASCLFYMAFIPVYIIILFVTIGIDYFAGIWIEQSQGRKRRLYLIISLVSTCLVLFIFKYFNFFNTNMTAIARFFDWNYPIAALNIILPIGLSFHTFQSLSYVIEVYRGNQKAERNFGIYSLYVMFYPQLVAGPIERPQNLLHQFYEKHLFDYDRVLEGLKFMAWGMFKKIVIADRLAIVVNMVYDDPHGQSGINYLLATVFFAFQIYCDFSGYSEIAIGSAKVMGFKLMTNFNRPYFSKSIAEFWKRWHISLSTWFRDYLYISLGGNRVSKMRWYVNLFITFFVSGLWHGANWTYVIWGGLNGLYLIAGIVTEDVRRRAVAAVGLARFSSVHKMLQVITTFTLICIAWIFFRARNLHDVMVILNGMTTYKTFMVRPLWGNSMEIKYHIVIGLCLVAFLLLIEFKERHGKRIFAIVDALPVYIKWAYYYGIFVMFLLFGVFHQRAQFIYFQF